jgi:hypothetical protein
VEFRGYTQLQEDTFRITRPLLHHETSGIEVELFYIGTETDNIEIGIV